MPKLSRAQRRYLASQRPNTLQLSAQNKVVLFAIESEKVAAELPRLTRFFDDLVAVPVDARGLSVKFNSVLYRQWPRPVTVFACKLVTEETLTTVKEIRDCINAQFENRGAGLFTAPALGGYEILIGNGQRPVQWLNQNRHWWRGAQHYKAEFAHAQP